MTIVIVHKNINKLIKTMNELIKTIIIVHKKYKLIS